MIEVDFTFIGKLLFGRARKFISFGSVIRPQPTCSISWIGGLHIGLPLDKHSLFSQNNSIKIKCALLKRCDAKRLSDKNVPKKCLHHNFKDLGFGRSFLNSIKWLPMLNFVTILSLIFALIRVVVPLRPSQIRDKLTKPKFCSENDENDQTPC